MKWNDHKKAGVKYVINAAFKEYNQNPEGYVSTFTTADEDDEIYKSFSKVYLKYYLDPTEYQFVEDVFDGNWEHWEKFREGRDTAEICQKLRKKAEKMRIAKAYEQITNIAYDENNKNNLQALKFLLGDTIKEEKKGAGRPKKAKAEPEVDTTELLEDVKRLKSE